MREWYAKNPEALEEKRRLDRERYERNREKVLEGRKVYYQNNKEMVKERQARYRAEAAVIIFEARRQPCADCGGEFPPACMQFHHLDPSIKTNNVRAMGHPTRVRREIAKCIVICANCHCIRHGAEDA